MRKEIQGLGGFIPFKCCDSKFDKSSFPYQTKHWNSFPRNIQSFNLEDFKMLTKTLKPKRYKQFNKGNKYTNVLLTRIRVGRSKLNQHEFSVGKIDSPECLCHDVEESPLHYFIDCFLYLQEHQTIFQLFEHYIPEFRNFTKKRKKNVHNL